MISKSEIIKLLFKIDQNKNSLIDNNLSLADNCDLPYPSTNGEIKFIPSSLIRYLKEQSKLIPLGKISINEIQALNRSIDPKFDGELRKTNSLAIRRGEKLAIRIPHVSDMEYLLNDLITFINTSSQHVIIKAAIAHVKLTILHPFNDGNGRTAHCLMNFILLQSGYPIIQFNSPEQYTLALEKTNDYEDSYCRFRLTENDLQVGPFLLLVCQILCRKIDENNQFLNDF